MIDVVRDDRSIADGLPVLASGDYLRSWSTDYGWFRDARFVLPFYMAKAGPFRHVVVTLDTQYLDLGATLEQERAFLNAVVAAAGRIGADFISQAKTTAVFRTVPDGSVHIPWGSYRLDLSPDEEALFSSMHPHHRRVIRKAKRDAVVVESGPDLMVACHAIIAETLARERKPCLPLDRLKAFRDGLGEGVSFYVAMHNGAPHTSALLISGASRCYYLVGGTRARRHHGAAALLHWTAMLDMKRRGVSVYDFVGGRVHPASGSKQEGLQLFKSRFGTRFHAGYLWKHPVRPWKYRALYAARRFTDFLRGSRYNEDMIDNEIRTEREPRSRLVPAPARRSEHGPGAVTMP